MKVLAVGDIHTKTWIVDEIVKLIPKYDRVVFVGDYADDWGKEPVDTISIWLTLMYLQKDYSDKVSMFIGNHDYAYAHKVGTSSGGYSMGTQFLLDLPDNKDLKIWLYTRPVFVEFDNVTYSHAGITESFNGELTERWLWEDNSPIWARPGYEKYKDMPQVFGHTPSETCYEVQPNIWCIDTFSTYPDGTPVGDGTVLEIIDGKTFNKIKLEDKNARNNNSTSRIKT